MKSEDTKDLTASPPKTFEVRMGAMSEPLTIQLAHQGIQLDCEKLGYQQDVNAVVNLYLRDVITESERDKARSRIMKKIVRSVKEAGAA